MGAQELTKAQSAQQTDEAEASQEAQQLAKAAAIAKQIDTQETQEVKKAKSAQKAAEEKATLEESHSSQALPEESRVDLVAENKTKAEDVELQEGSKAQSSVAAAGEIGFALMAQDA